MPVSLFIALLKPLKDGRDKSLSVAGVLIRTKFSRFTSILVSKEPIVLKLLTVAFPFLIKFLDECSGPTVLIIFPDLITATSILVSFSLTYS